MLENTNPVSSEHPARVYSTGELAQACGVSVRTVQYYDEKGLLSPSALTEGGRRVYTESEAATLRKILLLKSLGLQLSTIKGVLESDASSQVLIDILREQDHKLEHELEEKQSARMAIAQMIDGLQKNGTLPDEIEPDMEAIMSKTSWRKSELKPLYMKMLVVGIILDVFEVAAIIYWIATGIWRPFAIVMPFVILVAALVVRSYRKSTAYLCPHCRAVFVPKGTDWFFAAHTMTTRKVTCTECGVKDYCAEVSAERLAQNQAGTEAV